MKVAKLVTVSIVTRVIVNEDASELEIIESATENIINQVHNDLLDNIESIVEDTECPYNEDDIKK